MIREVGVGANKYQMLTNLRQSCEKVKVITMVSGPISNHKDISLHGPISSQKHILRFFSFILLLFYVNQKDIEEH